jgi:ATP-dependent exoDNAse (exonuclease V) beta subunit
MMSNLVAFPSAIQDSTEREQALDITRSLIVEAPAGSGKTGLLIQRFLKLLAHESVTDPAQVIAITFTRKATHEMRDRVLRQLSAAAGGDALGNAFDEATRNFAQAALARDRQLGWGLLDHPERLNISTIDGLCTRIAGSLPVLSGAGGQSPIDEAGELYAEAAQRTLNLLGGDDPALTRALTTLLLHRDGSLADCQKLISEMLAWRDQWGNLVPLSGAQLTDEYLESVTRPRLEAALELAICRTLTRLDKVMPRNLCEQLTSLASRMGHSDGYKGGVSPIAVCRELKSAPGTAATDLAHWRALAHLLIAPYKSDWRSPAGLRSDHLKLELAKAHKAELADLIASLSATPGLREALCELTTLPPLKYPQEQWVVAKALFRVLSRALVELQFVFELRGECDFTQLSLVARDALSRDGAGDDLALAVGMKLQHLLVDEMQDTSSSQYELIRLLTEHWDGASQTVFLVGDPKQSIYLFRQARVERFIDTLRQARLGDLPLTPIYLTANFRSQANLVEAFNNTFSRVFPTSVEAADSETVPYREAHANRKSAPGPHLEWHTTTIPYAAEPVTRQRQLEQNALQIRKLVEQWRARPLPPDRSKPWRIAVLIRNRAHLAAIVRAFKAAPDVPYKGVKTEPLGERQEILDLVALTRALLHRADRTAWLALLRTPWCGLTLRDLHLLAGQDDPAYEERTILDLIAERGDLLSADAVARLEPFWTVMNAAVAQRGRLPLSRWVERTWRAFGAEAFASAEELLNIEQFFVLLDELESRPGPVSISRLEQRLSRLYAAESSDPDAVELMTIHNAKGLEWDFVVVPELESGSARTHSRLLSWLEIEDGAADSDDVAHGIIAPVQPKGEQALALNKWMNSIHSAREAAERKRLFYVASTRAREELHLFAAPQRNAGGEIKPKSDSLLAAAWPAAEAHFQTTQEAEPLQIAASADLIPFPAPAERTIQRVPLTAFPTTNPGAPGLASETWVEPASFSRPEGSYEARTLGNATHTFLELLATRIAAGASPAILLSELPTWQIRVAAVLRASGLTRDQVSRASATVLRSLTRTLEDPAGLWLLSPHPAALSEAALSTASGTLRLDRTFFAGTEPLQPGSTHRWIVDYKTGTHAAAGLDAFLAEEKTKYAPQLEAYAAHLAADGHPIRLALYYPAIPNLIWWPYVVPSRT